MYQLKTHNVGAVCSEEKTEIKLKGQETTPSSTYLDVFTADRVSDLLANSFWLEFKNFKKKLKMEEKILIWTRKLST